MTDQDKKYKRTLFLLVTVNLILFIGAVGSFTVRPSPIILPVPAKDATANWKTFKNSDYGILFKYPNRALVSTKTLSGMLSNSLKGLEISPPSTKLNSNWYAFDLAVQNVDAQTLAQKYAQNIMKNCGLASCSAISQITNTFKPYKNGDIDGYIFHIGGQADSAMVIQPEGSKTYVFRISGNMGNITNYDLKIFDEILSTVRFSGSYSKP